MIASSARIGSVGRGLLALHLLLSPLLFFRFTCDAFETNKVALLIAVAVLLAALLVTRFVLCPVPNWRGHTPDLSTIGIGIFVLSAIASTIFSISPRTSLMGSHESPAGLLTIVGYAVLFVAMRVFCRDTGDARRLVDMSLLAAGVAATYAIVQAVGVDPFSWSDHSTIGGFNRPFATFGHPNFLAAFLIIVLPLAAESIRSAAEEGRWLQFAGSLMVCILAVVALGLTLSRSAWLAAGSAGVALGVGWFLSGCRRAAAVIVCLGIVGVVGLATVSSTNTETVSRLFQRIAQFGEVGARQFLWRAGWHMFVDHPFAGCGLDTYQLAFAKTRTPDYWRLEWNATPAKAHNEAIQILATQGMFGLIGVGVFTIGVVAALVTAWRGSARSSRPWLAALAAAVVGFCIQNLFGFTVVACGTLWITLTAMLNCPSRALQDEDSLFQGSIVKSRWMRWICVVGVWIGAAWLQFTWVVQPLRASIACAASDRVLHVDAHGAVKCMEDAVTIQPFTDIYWVKLGTAAQLAARAAIETKASPSSVESRRTYLLCAHEAFEAAVRLVPVNAYNHANLGRALGELAREGTIPPHAAFAAFDRALQLDPNNACFYVDAGNLALALGDTERATRYASVGLEKYSYYAPLRAIRGYVAMLDGRLREAELLLIDAICSEWQGDAAAHRFATTALDRVRSALRRADQGRRHQGAS